MRQPGVAANVCTPKPMRKRAVELAFGEHPCRYSNAHPSVWHTFLPIQFIAGRKVTSPYYPAEPRHQGLSHLTILRVSALASIHQPAPSEEPIRRAPTTKADHVPRIHRANPPRGKPISILARHNISVATQRLQLRDDLCPARSFPHESCQGRHLVRPACVSALARHRNGFAKPKTLHNSLAFCINDPILDWVRHHGIASRNRKRPYSDSSFA